MSPEAPAGVGEHRVVKVDAAVAHLIPDLLYRVFGYTYNDETLYDRRGVLDAVASGRSTFFLCLDGDGAARGVMALRFCFPSRAVAELGMLAVDPSLSAAASGRVLRLIGEAVTAEAVELARTGGLRALTSTEVTVHKLTQRLVQQFGFTTTGIYLGWTPTWAERLRVPPEERLRVKGEAGSARGSLRRGRRRSETVSVRPFLDLIEPYRVALPTRYQRPLRALYAELRLPVSVSPPRSGSGTSSLVEDVNLRRSRVLLELTTVGADAGTRLLERVAHFRDGGVELIHVALPLSGTDVDPAVDALLASGFRFAALLPFYRTHDVLVLQLLNGADVDLVENDLHSPTARMLFRELFGPSRTGSAGEG